MRPTALFLIIVLAACGGGTKDEDDSTDVGSVLDVVEVRAELPDLTAPELPADLGPETEQPDLVDAETTALPELEIPVLSPLVSPPAAQPQGLDSCPLIAQERCQGGQQQVCALWDQGSGDWAQEPPPMTLQAFWFDRYYDLYHEVEGQTMDAHFLQVVPYGTPEAEWSKPEYFEKYDGYGDASGWTGTAVLGAAARYRATGTDADYERMLTKLEKAMFLYEVTKIPGMIARSHGAMLPEGAPKPHGHWGRAIRGFNPCDGSDGHFCYPIEEDLMARVPGYYTKGVEIDGEFYQTAPTWQGDASRDMYVRGLPGLMAAYDLLREGDREDQVREVMRTELSCTLNRMKRGRIYNLDQNPEIKEALTAFLAGPNMLLEPGEEVVFTGADELVFFAMEQPHPLHWDLFTVECPAGPPMELDPEYELDAADPMFLLNLATLFGREAGQGDRPLAWTQHPAVRGSDTVFMTSWALTAHYLTGDEQYLEFVEDLMAVVPYGPVIQTYGGLQLPKWCAPHFGPSLLYPSLYHLLARIDKDAFPVFWNMLSSAVVSEGRDKDILGRDDCYFGILYSRMADTSTDPDVDAYVAYHAELLATYGMSPDDKNEPDRNVPRNFIDTPDPSIPLEEIPEDDLAVCTEPIDVMGIPVPAPGLEDDWPRAVDAVPLPKRVGGAFLWQMDPWMVKREYGGTGMDRQWPMLGMTVPYWVGRMDKVISEGQGLVLAWQPTEESCE